MPPVPGEATRPRAVSPGIVGPFRVTSGAPSAQVRAVGGPDRLDSQADSLRSSHCLSEEKCAAIRAKISFAEWPAGDCVAAQGRPG